MTLTLTRCHSGSANANNQRWIASNLSYNGRPFFMWPWLWKHWYGLTSMFGICPGSCNLFRGTCTMQERFYYMLLLDTLLFCFELGRKIVCNECSKHCRCYVQPTFRTIHDRHAKWTNTVRRSIAPEDGVRLPTWRGHWKRSHTQSPHPNGLYLYLYMYGCGCTYWVTLSVHLRKDTTTTTIGQ